MAGLLLVFLYTGAGLPLVAQQSGAAAGVPQEESAEVRLLSLDECLRLGMEASSQVAGARLGIQERQARSTAARRNRWGALELSGNYTRLSEVDPGSIELPDSLGPPLGGQSIELGGGDNDAVGFSLQVRQPLFTGYKITSGIARAELAVHSSRESYRKSVQAERFRITQAFWDLVEATELVGVMEKSVERADALVGEVTSRAQQGMATREDVLRVEMSREQAKVQHLQSVHSRELAELQLQLMLSLPESQGITPEYDFSQDFTAPPAYAAEHYNRLLSAALRQRPEVQLNRVKQEMQSAELRQISGQWLPSIALIGQMDYANPNSRQFPPEDDFLLTWRVGISGQIDIGGYKLIGPQKQAAEKALQQLHRQDEELIRSISLQIKQDVLNLEQAERQLQAAETILNQARENYRIVYDKYRSGIAVNSDVVTAQEKLLEAQLARSRAHIACRRSISKLRFDLGADTGQDKMDGKVER